MMISRYLFLLCCLQYVHYFINSTDYTYYER